MTENRDEQSTGDSLATVLSGGALVSAGKVLALGFGFFTQIAMARLLTEAAYGNVVLALAVVNIAGLVAKLGLDDGVMREYPHHEDDPAEAHGVVRASTVITVTSGLVTAIVLFLAAPTIARVVFDDASLIPLFRIGSIAIPFITTSSVAVSLARGARDARVQAYVRQIFQPAARLLFVGGLLLAGFNAVGAISGQIAAIVLAALAAFYMARRSLPSFDVSPNPMYRSVLAFSLPLIAVQGMGFLNSNVDVYMVGYFMNSSSLGVYNISLQLGNIVNSILGTTGFLLPPMLTRLQQRGQNTEMLRTYQVVTKWMVVLIIPVFIVLFFAPRLVIGLFFGESYTRGTLALRILLAGKFITIIMGLNSSALIALGKNRVVSYIVFCETAVNVAINFILIPVIGFEGAAIGMTISTIIGDALGVAILYRRFGLHPFTRSVLSPVAAIGVVSTVGYGTLWLLGLPTYLTVGLVGIAYLPIIAILAPEPEDEKLLTQVEDQTGYDLEVVRDVVSSFR
ncbi:flippase [Halobellus limi]|uniref:Flippase n=1 Tax=Halobellus limi TaxID=699433 RepID=A0A1H5TXH9_9EURY|nr:flippase [Halobellus limi]QCC47208.1 flippase [Halobellus limi]SEF67535.1 Membrane protein involved in the export of O-antigen and teichoic acid [Halobellus limi]